MATVVVKIENDEILKIVSRERMMGLKWHRLEILAKLLTALIGNLSRPPPSLSLVIIDLSS